MTSRSALNYRSRRAAFPIKVWATKAVHSARTRAAARGIAFAIDVAHLEAIAPPICPALSIPLNYRAGRGMCQNDAPTVDRLDPDAGYVPGNVAVISYKANRMKNNGSLAEHEALVAWMSQHQSAQDATME